MNKQLLKQLERHEGKKSQKYKCTAGKITQGIGRNLDDNPLTTKEISFIKDVDNWTDEEIYYILYNDLEKIIKDLKNKIDFFDKISEIRQNVLINMAFNLGINGLLKFKNTLHYIKHNEFENASREMLNSNWALQVPSRALELAEQLSTNKYKE